MDLEKRIDVLNTLVEINNDRLEGYETATKDTDEQDLKRLFGELASTSKRNNRELSDEIRKIGGEPTDSTRVSGKFFRAWMDVKAALTGKKTAKPYLIHVNMAKSKPLIRMMMY